MCHGEGIYSCSYAAQPVPSPWRWPRGGGDVLAGPLAPQGAGLGARPEIPGRELGGVVTPGSGTSSSVLCRWEEGGWKEGTGVPARRPRSRLALSQGPWHPAGPRHCW